MGVSTAHTIANFARRRLTRTKLWKAIWLSRIWRWKCISACKAVAAWCSRIWRSSWSIHAVTSAQNTGATYAVKYSAPCRILVAINMFTPSRSRRPRRNITAARLANHRFQIWRHCSTIRKPPRTIIRVCTVARAFSLKGFCAVISRLIRHRRDLLARIAAKLLKPSSTWPIISWYIARRHLSHVL